uniref:Zinc finger MYM-type protein 1-like n=1 Tax=Gadus morhua TaxID=8049 RepID=A0A8C5ARY7_GADMO
MLFLAKQGIAFRGHCEGEGSSNQGNLLECVQLLSKFDPFLQQYNAPANATYLSPSSQNDFIKCSSSLLTSRIRDEVREAKMFSIMADEAKDGNTEQLAVCVRYVFQERIRERFLCLRRLGGYDAESITNALEEVLGSHGIDGLKVVAQSYDGAAVMSGSVRGVQTRFREKHPEAIYVHCYAHELNLVLCHTCKAIPEASFFFDMLESLYSCFSTSIKSHDQLVAVQKELNIERRELVQISSTRWSCQVNSINALLRNFPAVIASLQMLNTPIAVGLLSKLSKRTTVYLLVVIQRLLGITEGFHRFLQGTSIDLARAVQFKSAIHDTLVSQRTEQVAEELYEVTKQLCSDHNLPEPSPAPRRKQRRMDDFVVEASTGSGSDLLNDSECLKQGLFFPCIDRMINELGHRFSTVAGELMDGIQACHPASKSFLCLQSLEKLATHYHIQLVPEEVLVAKSFLSRKDPDSIPDTLSVFKLLDSMMFPSLRAILQVALTIPVSSCSCERSFSALRRLHTWLRSTMGQERLNELAVLSIERELVGDITEDEVIDEFARLKSRRHTLILPPTAK